MRSEYIDSGTPSLYEGLLQLSAAKGYQSEIPTFPNSGDMPAIIFAALFHSPSNTFPFH
jgi:hypothetical protein